MGVKHLVEDPLRQAASSPEVEDTKEKKPKPPEERHLYLFVSFCHCFQLSGVIEGHCRGTIFGIWSKFKHTSCALLNLINL